MRGTVPAPYNQGGLDQGPKPGSRGRVRWFGDDGCKWVIDTGCNCAMGSDCTAVWVQMQGRRGRTYEDLVGSVRRLCMCTCRTMHMHASYKANDMHGGLAMGMSAVRCRTHQAEHCDGPGGHQGGQRGQVVPHAAAQVVVAAGGGVCRAGGGAPGLAVGTVNAVQVTCSDARGMRRRAQAQRGLLCNSRVLHANGTVLTARPGTARCARYQQHGRCNPRQTEASNTQSRRRGDLAYRIGCPVLRCCT